jgi:hypothetical protein
MAIKDGYRIRQLSTSTGDGVTITLATPPAGYNAFSTLGTTGVEFFYSIEAAGGTAWEYGIGSVASGELSRNTVLGSSNAGNRVVLPVGTHEVTNGPIPGKATGDVNFQDLLLQRPEIRDYSETVATPSVVAGVLTLDLETANVFSAVHNANITSLAVTNPPITGKAGSFTLHLTQGSTGGYAITFPASFKYGSTTAPTIPTTASKRNKFVFDTLDGGVTWDVGYCGLFDAFAYIYNPVPNGVVKGYMLLGISASGLNKIEGIQFSNDTTFTPFAAFTGNGRSGAAGVSSSTKGYAMGGDAAGSIHKVNTIDGIVFGAAETYTSTSAFLSIARTEMASFSSSAKGYAAGGWDMSPYMTTIDGIRFSNESSVTSAVSLATGRQTAAGVSSSIKGYVMGGHSGAAITDIESVIFGDPDTYSNTLAALSSARYSLAGIASSEKGYSVGGMLNSTQYTVIDGIRFSDESAITTSAVLSVARYGSTGVSSGIKGYVMGGYSSANSNVTDVLQFGTTTDTASTPSSALLALAKYNAAGVQG